MAFSYTFRTDTPGANDNPGEAYSRIQETKKATQEREDVDHYWQASASNTYDDTSTGEHRKVTLRETTKPTAVTDKGFLYAKDTSGATEFYYEDAAGNEKQITAGGKLNIAATDIPADTVTQTHIELANNADLVGSNAAGDGDVNLIKANTSDVPVLGTGAQTASSAAPTADADVANKKYVDDEITTVTVGTRVTTDALGAALAADSIYLAGSAGILTVIDLMSLGTTLYIYVGASNPPDTVIGRVKNMSLSDEWHTLTALVASGEYVKTTVSSGLISNIYWQPFGSGDLTAQ